MVSFFSVALSFSIALCIGVSLLLIVYTYKASWYNWLLAAFFTLLAYHCFVTLLISTGYILLFPHFYRTGNIACLLYMPISYFYVRSVITDERLTKKDFFHIIPAVVYVLDFFPFFLLPGKDKMIFFTNANLNRSVIMYNESKFFPDGFYVSLKYILACFYWILQSILIIKALRFEKQMFKRISGMWLKWLILFCFSQMFLFVPPLALLNRHYETNLWISFLFIGGGTGLTSVFLLLFPRILYGKLKATDLQKETDVYNPSPNYIFTHDTSYIETSLVRNGKEPEFDYSVTDSSFTEIPDEIIEEDMKEDNSLTWPLVSQKSDINLTHNIKEEQPTAYRHLSEERMTEIYAAIQDYFITSQPYLKLHYTLQQLSIHMNIPSQYISVIIHEFEKVNFNDFVNKYRVEYCVRIMQNNEHKSQTLEAIARKSGFNNRNTFTLAFKKITGKTPSEYIKSISIDQ